MYFSTTQSHEEFRAKIRAFAEEKIAPNVVEFDANNQFPEEAIKELGEMGLMGIQFPEKYGGAGLTNIHYSIAVEELSRVDAGAGVILSAHASLGSNPIYEFGTEEQKQKYLVPLAKGEKIGAFGLTEDNAGSDAGETETTAVLDGDYYILNGSKIFITNAPYADIYIIFAVTTPGIGVRGISAFIVEKEFEGFDFGEIYDKMGIRSSSTGELLFNNVKVPKENLLGEEGQGFKIAMKTLDGGRIGIASQALGIGQGAYEAAVNYTLEREQFGMPVVHNQALTFRVADMATELRAARMLVYSAAALKDQAQVDHDLRYGKEAAMAKLYASDLAVKIANEAVQMYGGAGFIKGMPVEKFYRDAKITTIYEGTNEIMRVVIGANIVGPAPKAATVETKQEDSGRRQIMFNEGSAQDKVDKLVAALKEEGHDFTVGIPIDTPIVEAERVVSVGRGIGEEENMELIEKLANNVGAAIGGSRPVAETLKYLPIDRYVGMSGQKFRGNLYIAVGISGAGQHLKGIKDASTIVAINSNPNAKIFKNADYGIVGDLFEIVPLLTEALDTGEKAPAPEMVKMKRIKAERPKVKYDYYTCTGCGYIYDPEEGDPEGDIRPGTKFEDIPEDWTCPACGEEKDQYILG